MLLLALQPLAWPGAPANCCCSLLNLGGSLLLLLAPLALRCCCRWLAVSLIVAIRVYALLRTPPALEAAAATTCSCCCRCCRLRASWSCLPSPTILTTRVSHASWLVLPLLPLSRGCTCRVGGWVGAVQNNMGAAARDAASESRTALQLLTAVCG